MITYCPKCKQELTGNYMEWDKIRGKKPKADWFCPHCFSKVGREFVWYDFEVLKG
jgi:hypothetical protein